MAIQNLPQAVLGPLILITPKPEASPEDLVFSLIGSSLLFSNATLDFVEPGALYHGGNPIVAQEDLVFFDCDPENIAATNETQDVISDTRIKGVIAHPTPNVYLWDEVYTTPLGLYQHNPDALLGDAAFYEFNLTSPNTIQLRTEDVNITPKVDDYITLQRFFDNVSTETLESTTDDQNHLDVLHKSETYTFKITDVDPGVGIELDIDSASNTSPIVVAVANNISTGLSDGDRVAITGVQGNEASNGTFVIQNVRFDPNVVTGPNTLFDLYDLDGVTPIGGSGAYTTGGSIKILPVFTMTIDKSFAPLSSLFVTIDDGAFAGVGHDGGLPLQLKVNNHGFSTGNKILIGETGVTELDDQTFFVTVVDQNNFTLDGIDGALFGSITVGPAPGPNAQLAPAKYTLTLLNRKGTTLNRELFLDTWQQLEVHRQQLLGDPFEETSLLKFQGRKNYLNYSSREYLGIQHLLRGIITERKTPFVVFDLDDDVKDRLYWEQETIEVELPTIMVQGESSSQRLILKNVNSNPTTIDRTGSGRYDGLYFVDASTTPAQEIRYGWVFYDLRIIVIDHPELATALGHNSNRNYTLPAPALQQANTIQNPTSANPVDISGATDTTPILVTTAIPHGFVDGDEVIITGVFGNQAANGTFIVDQATATTFALLDDTLTSVSGSGAYTAGGTVVSTKLAHQHFITYRINGVHYDTLPYADPINFNFDTSGQATVTIDPLTHLVDSTVQQGFEATTIELIIGRYKADPINSAVINGFEYAALLPTKIVLKDPTDGNQANSHQITFNKSDVEDVNGDILGGVDAYDLVNVVPHYELSVAELQNNQLFTGDGIWNVGSIRYKQQAQKYRLTFSVKVPANRWNGTTNPSFEPGNSLMNSKFFTEIAFLLNNSTIDEDNNVIDDILLAPYIYGKISPPIEKTNTSDLNLEVSIDF